MLVFLILVLKTFSGEFFKSFKSNVISDDGRQSERWVVAPGGECCGIRYLRHVVLCGPMVWSLSQISDCLSVIWCQAGLEFNLPEHLKIFLIVNLQQTGCEIGVQWS